MWRQLLRPRGRSLTAKGEELLSTLLQRRVSVAHCSSQGPNNVKTSILEDEATQKSHDAGEDVNSWHKESPRELLENANPNRNSEPLGPDDIWSDGPYPTKSNFNTVQYTNRATRDDRRVLCHHYNTHLSSLVARRSQAKHSYRPNIDPKETSIIFFPGQGTQYVGMGKELLKYPNVEEMYEAASEILGYNLLELSLNGPANKLSKTIYQQPAIVVASLAAVEKLRDERPSALESCVGVAGYSVGEITALTFAGSLSFEDAIKLVKVRAEAMQYASEITPSGMMTVLYGPDSRLGFACSVAKEFCERKGLEEVDCRIASYLYPHCKVIAGNNEALSFIDDNKADFRLKRLKRLPVSGAFHTNLMRPAAKAVSLALEKIRIEVPIIPVHSNVDGKQYMNIKQVVKQLPKQIYSPVKWEQTMHSLYERAQGTNFPKTFECGPNKTLKTILKMVNAKAWDSCISVEA